MLEERIDKPEAPPAPDATKPAEEPTPQAVAPPVDMPMQLLVQSDGNQFRVVACSIPLLALEGILGRLQGLVSKKIGPILPTRSGQD